MTRAQYHLIGLLPAPTPKAKKAVSQSPATATVDSSFIAEMALPACELLVEKLDQQKSTERESDPSNTLTLEVIPQQQLGLFMRYLEHIASPLKLTLKIPKTLDKPSNPALTRRENARPERSGRVIEKRRDWLTVEHQSLGHGVIVKADDDYLTIQFAGEKGLRTFRRDVVEPLLTVSEARS